MRKNIQRKLHEIETLANDTRPEVIDALSSIDNANANNGNFVVRSSLEEKELANLNNFISSFSQLSNSINLIFKTINDLDKSCDSMLEKLSIGDKGVDEVLDMTTSLHSQQEKQKHQLNKIHNFIDEFYLPKADLEVLNAGDINDGFFDAFARLETVQERTTTTLRTSSNQSTCLLDVSASLNKTKESAYQRMYNWLHMNSHLFDSIHPCVGSSYEKCLSVIKVKIFLFRLIVDEIAKVRGEVIGRSFLRALTTGQDKDTKPIEASSSVDPLQFIGDMFAWIHQSTATESAFLASLLKEDQNSSKSVKSALAIVFDSIVRPLEPRVQQAMKNLARPADFYQVANICAFFAQTFGDICGMTSSLYRCADSLKLTATDGFKRSISDSIDEIKTNGQRPTEGAINEAIRAVAEITTLHKQSSLSASFDIGSLIDSYANGLKTAIEDLSNKNDNNNNNSKYDNNNNNNINGMNNNGSYASSSEVLIFQTNALYELFIVCKEANLMSKSAIGEEVNNLLSKIVENDANDIFVRCRIIETVAMCDIRTEQPLSTIRGLEPDSLKSAVKRFEASVLESTRKVITPRCDSLQNADLRQRAHREVVEALVAAYRKMYNVAMNPNNGYDSPGTMFKNTPELFGEMLM